MTQDSANKAPEMTRHKAALGAKLKELIGGSIRREDLEIEHWAEALDQLKSNLDRELTIERLDQQTRLIRDIQLALMAIEEGTYGTCARCEEAIPPRRLDAVPWALLCVGCQSDLEAAEDDQEPLFRDAA